MLNKNLEDITLHKKYSDKELFLMCLNMIKPVIWWYILGLIVVFVNVGLTIVLPLIMGGYIDFIEKTTIVDNWLTIALMMCAVYFVIVLINAVCTYFQVVIFQKASQTIIYELRQKSFEKIMTLSNEQLSKIPVGRLVTRVNSDTNAVNQMFTEVIANLIKNALTIISIYITMFFLNPILTGYISIVMAFLVVITIFYRKYSTMAFTEERKQVSNLNSFLSENLSGIKLVQTFNQEESKKEEFAKTNKKLFDAKMFIMFVFSIYRPLISFMYYTSIAITFYFGFMMLDDVFTFGVLFTFYTFTVNLFGPVQRLADQFDMLQSGLVAISRTFNLLEMEEIIKESDTAIEVEHIEGKIEFKNVWFAYEGENWVLKDVSFVIEPGQTVAFVGATGSGKTTILSLISRNYDIQKGQILIDGIDIKEIKLSSLRRKIGQMLQDVFIFSGTVKDNITLKNNSYTQEEIDSAIEYVNAYQFINKMPNGLMEIVSENGSNISSGQRQLISFARTIITKPQLLILDEATANIDTETEALIQESLEKMKSIGTMLIVAHRLSTIKNADNVICLSHGEIVEQGDHETLLKKDGYYAKLYKIQLKESL